MEALFQHFRLLQFKRSHLLLAEVMEKKFMSILRMSDQKLMVEEEEKDLPFYMTYVPEFFRKKCELELNETPERKKQCLRELRITLKNDDVAKDVCFHEDLLIQYLRHSKYNTDKALKQIQNLLVFRRKEARYFESVPDEYFSTKASVKFTSILPKRSPDGCTVVLCRLAKWDPNELEFDDFVRILFITYLQIFRDPMTQINGFKIIHDFAGTRFEHLKYGTPRNLYLFYHVSLYCIPGRYKEIHLINETPVLRIMWTIIKRFLSAKIRSRVFFHSDSRELLNYFPKSVLPEQYGGDILDVDATNFPQRANEEQRKNTLEGQPNFF